ncbi:MAG: TrkH family potassium uptake protein [Faecalibacillus sp.]
MEERRIHKPHKVKEYSAVRRIGFSFLMVILIGSILLTMPFSTNKGATGTYLDHLFAATSATCVTGLVTKVTCQEYTFIGQLIIVVLIQIGGLGFLTLMSMMYVLLRKKLTFSNKLVMQEALNKDSLKDLSLYIKRVIKYTAFFEILGAICLSFVFIPEFGPSKGIYYSIFHSISAFCNAGFDVLGDSSLCMYANHIWINLVVCGLIIAGGLGFIVWIDLRTSLTKYQNFYKRFTLKRFLASLSLHTKIVIIITTILIFSGTVGILLLEFHNTATIGSFSFGKKVLASFFQSVTLRTAGFATIDIGALKDATKLLMCIFMFIGGSPAGTAGGIKTVTFAIVFLYIRSLKRGETQVHVMKKTISDQIVKRSLTIAMVSLFIVITGVFALSIVENGEFLDLMFEVFSAFATVGLTAGVTPLLSAIGKVVIIILMYIGRIGPITMVLIFARKYNLKKGKNINYVEERVLIG